MKNLIKNQIYSNSFKNFKKSFNTYSHTFTRFSYKNLFFKTKSKMEEDKMLLNKNNKIKIAFNSKIKVSKDCYILRFLLQDQNSHLGCTTCQYFYLEAKLPNADEVISRPYHPISMDTDKGFVDILVKVYPKNESDKSFGAFSNFLINLEEGQVIALEGPHGGIKYQGNGEFEINRLNENITKKVNKIGMIAGGTGITPIFQLIQKVASTRDHTALSLLYATQYIDDMSFCEDLVKFDSKGKLNFFPIVEHPNSEKWIYGTGYINEEMIDNYMPSSKDNSLILLCGPKNMVNNHLKPLLKAMNYLDENILTFE